MIASFISRLWATSSRKSRVGLCQGFGLCQDCVMAVFCVKSVSTSTRPVKRPSRVSQRRKAGTGASVGTVAVEPVNRASGLAVASGCRVLPTLAALGVGCRERVRQGWPDASHPALRSGLPAATGFASRHAPGKVQGCPVSPRRLPARWRSGKPSSRCKAGHRGECPVNEDSLIFWPTF